MQAGNGSKTAAMRDYFTSGAARSYRFRRTQLQLLRKAIKLHEARLLTALYLDLRKPVEEAFATEIGFIYTDITHTLQHLEQWMEPAQVPVPLVLFPSSGQVVRDPLGVCLIIAPWNYPFQLLFSPLIGAIAGGNCAILKPSELAPNTAMVVEQLIRETFPVNYISTVQGEGREVVPALLASFRFDHIFFTGSIATGKAIALQAAAELIPVTLELGGKSPCIVDKDADIPTAAARIVWGKFTNAGQTCVAPDYVLVHTSRKAALLQEMVQAIGRFYGADARDSSDYGRIIHRQRFDTLLPFLSQGHVVTGGQADRTILYIAPTILDEVDANAPVMQEEIFGPVLPVFSYDEHEEAIAFIQRHPNPLSLYIFSNRRSVQLRYSQLSFGGGCINNTLMHVGNMHLPFGGVGYSGMGQYHGRYSFDTFTRPKSILKTATWIDPSVKYPPYRGKLKWLRWFFK